MNSNDQNTAKIRTLNNQLRRNDIGGDVFIANSITRWGPSFVTAVREAVRNQLIFAPGDDPDGTQEFGSLKVDSTLVYWKIDYFEKGNEPFLSPDPADPNVTWRVLTIMSSTGW